MKSNAVSPPVGGLQGCPARGQTAGREKRSLFPKGALMVAVEVPPAGMTTPREAGCKAAWGSLEGISLRVSGRGVSTLAIIEVITKFYVIHRLGRGWET